MINRKSFFIIYNICIILLFIYFIACPSYVIKENTNPIENRQVIDKFGDETVIEQEFMPTNNYDSYGIYFSTFDYIHKKGNITVDLVDVETKKHCKKNIFAASLINNTPTKINCQLEKNKKYSLKIKVKNINKKHKITLYCTSYDDDNYKLLINNKESENNLIMYYYKNNRTYSNMIYIILLLILDIIIYPYIFSKK